MAQLIDEVLEAADDLTVDNEETGLPEVEDINQEPDDGLPEKYRGKSAKDIIAMHQEAEKLLGKQGSEVGELRRVVDDFIKTQSDKQLKTEETEEDDELDYFTDPKKAIKRAIDNDPSIKEAKANSVELKRNTVLSKLNAEHPGYMDIVNDTEFQEWIMKSNVRQELFSRAENKFDYEAADELLSTWKEKKEVTKKVVETSRTDRDQQLKSADVGSNGVAPTVSKKKYRRSDIIKLMQTDPSGYAARADEIQQAYAEGRVY